MVEDFLYHLCCKLGTYSNLTLITKIEIYDRFRRLEPPLPKGRGFMFDLIINKPIRIYQQ